MERNARNLGFQFCYSDFEEKVDIVNCGMYRGEKPLEHAMTIVERVLENGLRIVIPIDDMQFGFMPGIDTIDSDFIFRKIHEEYLAKQTKSYMCFVDLYSTRFQ